MSSLRLIAFLLSLTASVVSYGMGVGALRGRPIRGGRRAIPAHRLAASDLLMGTFALLMAASILLKSEGWLAAALMIPGLVCLAIALYLQRAGQRVG